MTALRNTTQCYKRQNFNRPPKLAYIKFLLQNDTSSSVDNEFLNFFKELKSVSIGKLFHIGIILSAR